MTNWKPAEPELWAQARATIESDGVVGEKFLQFLDHWVGSMEGHMQTLPPMPMCDVLRVSLVHTEQALGIIDTPFLGEIMSAIGLYWQHRDEFIRSLSPIEIKVAGDALSNKLAQASADQRAATKAAMEQASIGVVPDVPDLVAPEPITVFDAMHNEPTPDIVAVRVHDHAAGDDMGFAYAPPTQEQVNEFERYRLVESLKEPDPAHDRVWWSSQSRWVYPGEPFYESLNEGRQPNALESDIIAGANAEGLSVAEFIEKHGL